MLRLKYLQINPCVTPEVSSNQSLSVKPDVSSNHSLNVTPEVSSGVTLNTLIRLLDA